MVPGHSNTSNIFGYQKFSETRKGFPTNFIGSVGQHIFDDKSWSSPLIHELFPYRKVFETQKGSPSGGLRRFQTKNSRWKVLILPTFYPETFSLLHFFWNTAQEDSHTKIIGAVRQKFFGGKSWYSPFLFINVLANGNFQKHSTGLFAYDFIRYCETKNFWQKIVILSSSHPFYSKISSISEFFWNTEGFPLRRIPALLDKINYRKILILFTSYP